MLGEMSMPFPFECLTARQLRQLLRGELPEAEQPPLLEHLEKCPRCQEALEHQAADREGWTSLRRDLQPAAPPSPALARVMESLKRGDTSPALPADDLADLAPSWRRRQRRGSWASWGHTRSLS
jgi:anti-sigma factor RsiW